ncbi:MAG: diguanylate cyclase [Gammaproteobacteria bacterium]|nr:diguanylate cyclase [Gammaproteobacteria bacterium]MDH5777437.1 diguanylate cyclase [Gammaproteobacteria bacterium]
MDLSLFQRLTASELDQYISEIDLAMEYHNRWLAAVNRAMVCRDASDLKHFSQDLVHQCYFGRWYDGVEQEDILREPVFKKIGTTHAEMHTQVRVLIDKLLQDKNLSTADYDGLIRISSEFRKLVGELKGTIKHDLRLIATLMGKVFENASEGVIITDVEGSILNVNTAFCQVTGYSREEVLGKNPRLLHSGKQDSLFYRKLWDELTEHKRWEGEIWNKRKNGEIYPEWLMITAVLDETGETSHYIAIFSDVSSQKESEERLFYLAHYDNLSKLPNRLAFHDRLKLAISQAKRNQELVAVMFLDLDGFKKVNDSMGHNAGDEVIREVAIRLGKVMRETDTISRFGGDEFTILLPEADSEEGVEIAAQKIIDAISEPIKIGDALTNVTTSIGISLFPHHGDDGDALIKLADMAMYEAKDQGKNRFLFYKADQPAAI